MVKKILVTSTELMMIQFLVPHVKNLVQNGYEVEVACSEVGGRFDEVKESLKDDVTAIHKVRLYRSPVQPKNILGYRDMKKVISQGQYDLIWTNEPVMGVVTRLAAMNARKKGTKVLYMAHGFHFYKGAPKKYWMAFYPIEYIMSFFTDILVTINREDYRNATKFHAREVKYIHGIGVRTERLDIIQNDNLDIRSELSIPEDAFVAMTIGELHPRKNQQVIIKALGILRDMDIHLLICGKGDLKDELIELAEKNEVVDNIHFLGYRQDISDICKQSDIFVFPSKREGLGIAALEAMYCGLPVVSSNINGINDYMENGKTGFLYDPDDAKGFAKGIRTLKNHAEKAMKCGKYNKEVAVKPFLLSHSLDEVLQMINSI